MPDKIFKIFPKRNFQFKVTLVVILAVLFVLFLSNLLVYRFSSQAQFESIRKRLMIIASVSALMVDADKLTSIPLDSSGAQTPAYGEIKSQLQRIKQVNPDIKYIYTMTKTDRHGIFQFIVDADPLSAGKKGNVVSSLPGETYDATRSIQMIQAFSGPTADENMVDDEWGVFLSGYAPVKDRDGNTVAIIGVDIAADDVKAIEKEVIHRMMLVTIAGIILAIFIGISFSGNITDPVKKLFEGTRKISSGDLFHRVDIEGEDEIHELASSFNTMAQDLSKTHQKLLKYFHDIFRIFVTVLNVRDQYTKGHSDAVAKLALKVALKMGVPRSRAKLFRKIAVLHDIGKVGIEDRILNKPGPLTDEERLLIEQHTLIGEEILKPVFDDVEMLQVIRHHHERIDGKGYPDKLKGDEISLLAAIVSVTDAYHAMTSDRVYRKALSHEEAIHEIKRHSGTQFHSEVVQVFIQLFENKINKG